MKRREDRKKKVQPLSSASLQALIMNQIEIKLSSIIDSSEMFRPKKKKKQEQLKSSQMILYLFDFFLCRQNLFRFYFYRLTIPPSLSSTEDLANNQKFSSEFIDKKTNKKRTKLKTDRPQIDYQLYTNIFTSFFYDNLFVSKFDQQKKLTVSKLLHSK